MTTWVTEGPQINPLTAVLLADSGATHVAEYVVTIIATSTLLTPCVFQWRNAANNATLQEQSFNIMANEPFQNIFKLSTAANNERFRIMTAGLLVGTVQASMMIN